MFIFKVMKQIQWTLFIMTFVLTAKFIITSVQIAQKSANCVFFIDSLTLFRKTYVFYIFKNHLTEAILTNTQNVWFIEKLYKSICYSCSRWIHIKFLYNSKFDLAAKSLVTNNVFINKKGSSVYQSLCICVMTNQPCTLQFHVHLYRGC